MPKGRGFLASFGELGLSHCGKNKSDIRTALYQNAFAGITAKTRYRQADGSVRTLESGFTRYSVIFTGEKLPDGRKADGVYIIMNDVFMSIINGAMTRPLDYDYLKSLPPAPQRFYEILSYQMYASLKWDRPRARLVYSDFCARAPQTRHTDGEKVRSQMDKIHRPHKESGYIAKVETELAVDLEGKPDWIFYYQPGPKARAEYQAFTKRGGPSVLEIEPRDSPLIAAAGVTELELELVRRGVTAAAARELVRNHTEEQIREQIERVEWLAEKKPEKVQDLPAYLVGAIKNDYAPPKGFVSKAEQQRRKEARQAKEREAAEEHRRKLGQEAYERKLQKLVESRLAAMTPRELAELDAESKAVADPDALAGESGPFGGTLKRLRHVEHLRQALRDQEIRA